MKEEQAFLENLVREKYKDLGVYRFVSAHYKLLKAQFAIFLLFVGAAVFKLLILPDWFYLSVFLANFLLVAVAAIDHAMIGRKFKMIEAYMEYNYGKGSVTKYEIGLAIEKYLASKKDKK